MSIYVMSAVWLNGPKQRSERLLLLAVADHADEYTGIAFPSTKLLAAKASMTTRNVSRALESLKIAGWLEILPRTHERGGHTYQLNLAKLNYFGPPTSQDKLSGHRKHSADKMSSHREPSPDKMSSQGAEVDQTFSLVERTISTVDQTNQPSRPDISNTVNNIVFNHHEPPIEPPKRSSSFEVPDWVPAEQWNHFIEMRASKRNKPTAHAAKLLITKLDQFRSSGQDPGDVLDQSTANGWMGIFPLKGNQNGSLPHAKSDGNMAVLANSIAEDERENGPHEARLLSTGRNG
jgi:hypothetical protein